QALEGITLRLYNPDEKSWRIWWASEKSRGHLDEPVVGHFADDGTGTFECDDTYQDTPVRVRYVWSDTRTDHPRWAQSFSTDGGATWELNWQAVFTRR
ncbi:MAG TPA: hypothetical protein VKB69_12685, partial [Micromonosporaceae bacterium]|nr:hypothetical protein [Micromonosporaceae bacterium]